MSALLLTQKKARLPHLNFAQCWEDPETDSEAMRIQPDADVLLTITSGGDSTLNLLGMKPRRVISLDPNPCQSAMLHLKVAGIRTLDHGEFLELLDVRRNGSTSRRRRMGSLYAKVRPALEPAAQSFWDRNLSVLRKGVLQGGRFERYLAVFRRLVRGIHGRHKIEGLFRMAEPAEQSRYYTLEWDTPLWRLFCRVFFSETVLRLGGIRREELKQATGMSSFGETFRKRFEMALMQVPVRWNYFMAQIFLGRYLDERAVPPYLLEENFAALKDRVDRVEIVTGDVAPYLETIPDGSIDCWSLSNVFEWLDEAQTEGIFGQVLRASRNDARVSYRNLLILRRHPAHLAKSFEAEDALADRLLLRDRAFFYSNFEIERVKKT